MIFNMNNADMTANTIYNQTKIILSQSNLIEKTKKSKKVFKLISSPSFSTSSANKNINYTRNKVTKNG